MKKEKLELKILEGREGEISEVQRVLEESPNYFINVSGDFPSSEDGKELFSAIAPGKEFQDKFVFGIYLNNYMIGCIDLCRGFPNASTVTLGLLLLSENHQRKGLGARAYKKLEETVKGWKNIKKIRIGVLVSNIEVLPFWKKMGYSEKGRKPYKHGDTETEVITLDKSID
ncbi:GNAT family N-acetyltransferase [candidate division WOR-3 bacterium]|nr:GNAT family N-acetyltransferase [candidate division WOR-3 bacterium]